MDKYLSVSTINRYIKTKLDSDKHLQNVYIKGEISNFKAHYSGHLYFSIKDETSKINAIMFNSSAKNLKFVPSSFNTDLKINLLISILHFNKKFEIFIALSINFSFPFSLIPLLT